MITTDLRTNPDMCRVSWQPINQGLLEAPSNIVPWLTMPSSLTEALKALTQHFRVEVLEEQVLSLDPALSVFFPDINTPRLFSRKVLLIGNDQPWVAAHTLIAQDDLNRQLNAFANLQQRPLGELLFADNSVRKDSTEVACYQQTWGRRNRYWLREAPILISEFFLPELISHEQTGR